MIGVVVKVVYSTDSVPVADSLQILLVQLEQTVPVCVCVCVFF